MLVETHANLHHPDFEGDVDAVIKRAEQAGIATIVNICCQMDEFEPVLKLAKSHANSWCTIGVHPHYAARHKDLKIETLIAMASDNNVIAIGETGLDYHYDFSPKDDQIANFLTHIKAAQQTKLPMVIHTREADDDMEDILVNEHKKQPFEFVLHSYTSGKKLAETGVELGGYFSVNGICTFKNAKSVREIIKDIMPDNRIMLETDCPYLTPVPHRGKRNEPAFLPLVRDQLAEIKGWSTEQSNLLTTDAFFELFSRAKRP